MAVGSPSFSYWGNKPLTRLHSAAPPCRVCICSVADHRGQFILGLTERQEQCLRGFLQRKTAKQIGRELGITHHAVEQHLKAARRKLGAADTLEAARMYAASLATAEPYYGSPELPANPHPSLADDGVERAAPSFHDVATESRGTAYELTATQTLVAIALVSLGMVAILALLIAIAQGVDALTS
jgi:DNA-binding CsgD family transcriptional regulator